MSNLIYPVLPGLMFDSIRTPLWSSNVQTALTRKKTAIGLQQYPQYRFTLQYEVLRHALTPSELLALAGLFNAVQAQADTFLYSDPVFNTVTGEPFGTGDGSTKNFQLIATWQNVGGPGSPDLIQNLNGAPVIKDNGVTKTAGTDYTLGPTGIIAFGTAPVAAHALTWTGSWYYRCRFPDDTMDFTQFQYKLWSTGQIAFESEAL